MEIPGRVRTSGNYKDEDISSPWAGPGSSRSAECDSQAGRPPPHQSLCTWTVNRRCQQVQITQNRKCSLGDASGLQRTSDWECFSPGAPRLRKSMTQKPEKGQNAWENVWVNTLKITLENPLANTWENTWANTCWMPGRPIWPHP